VAEYVVATQGIALSTETKAFLLGDVLVGDIWHWIFIPCSDREFFDTGVLPFRMGQGIAPGDIVV
jgi:hypothetical protein